MPAEGPLLAAVLDCLPVGIAICGPDGRLLYANAAADQHGLGEAGSTRPDQPLAADAGTEVSLQTSTQPLVLNGRAYEVRTSVDVTAQRGIESELFRRAYFDDMTGLPNRSLIELTVQNHIANGGDALVFGLAFVDVDNFKHINDYYGHAVGDGLLVKIARRIAAEIRSADVLARVGGDEFVLLFTEVDSIESLRQDVHRLSQRLKEPFFIDGHEIFSSASIGVTFYPDHGNSYEVLRVKADSAMYRIKSARKGGFKLFDPTIGHAATERMKLEQRLRLAIRDRRLCCAFQPKVDFRSDKVVGVEVLLRWRDEEGMIRAPGDFVKLAVELGLMDEITLTVLDQTVAMLERIDDAFGPETSISINIAAKQAGDLKFMTAFAGALQATGCAERFMVELTEEAFLVKGLFQKRILPMLRDVGARVSIDDFGVGYSSLSALADITADEIKVDRSFITAIHQRPRSQSILKAIESLGHALGMSIIVEGVETYEELAYLEAASRIRFAQGYYFAKPMLLDDLSQRRTPTKGIRLRQFAREPGQSRFGQGRESPRGGGRSA